MRPAHPDETHVRTTIVFAFMKAGALFRFVLKRKNPMLSLISMVTGVAGGILALVQARRQPQNATQMYLFSAAAFGMAILMVVLSFL